MSDNLRRQFLDNLWCWKVEVPEKPIHLTPLPMDLDKTQWSLEFERLMRNRLVQGAFRYGRLHDPDRPVYNCVTSAIAHLKDFQKTGNLENLVDTANLCMVEFETGKHPKRHFCSLDDSPHTKEISE